MRVECAVAAYGFIGDRAHTSRRAGKAFTFRLGLISPLLPPEGVAGLSAVTPRRVTNEVGKYARGAPAAHRTAALRVQR